MRPCFHRRIVQRRPSECRTTSSRYQQCVNALPLRSESTCGRRTVAVAASFASCSRFVRSSTSSRFASSRFAACDRPDRRVTTSPLGTCVTRIAVSTLFRRCPPRP